MKDIYTIAIDASTKSTGVAVFKNQKLIKYECITQSSKNVLKRIKGMTDAIEKIYTFFSFNNFCDLIEDGIKGEGSYDYDIQIVMEQIIPDNLVDVAWAKNQNTFKALFYLQAAIVLMFDHYDKEVEFMGASTWRRLCGIQQGRANRDILKARDIKFVKEHYFLEVNDDIADAICLGHAKIHEQPEPQPFNWE